MYELTVGKNDAGQRLDKFLTKALHLPAGLLYKSIRKKKIKVNRKRAENNTLLCEGDTVQCFLPEEFLTRRTEDIGLGRIQPRLDILYEDGNILLLNKRPGVSVHEDEHNTTDTLIVHVQSYLYQKGEYDPADEQSFAPALCNRIDRNTGGIVIAAKNAAALRVMNEKIRRRDIEKYYLAVVHGIPDPPTARLTGYLLKDERENRVRVYDRNPPKEAKTIVTEYRVIARGEDTALTEIRLVTGRTHQIRAHMAHIGHPLLGDGKYGINRPDRKLGYKYQALYAYRLKFPKTGEDNLLSYLEGREFSVPKDEIYFTAPFFHTGEKKEQGGREDS